MRYLLIALVLTFGCDFKPQPPVATTDELVKVCWGDSGLALVKEACDKPEPIIWPQGRPLKVYSNPATYLMALQAVDVWNKELGFEMFEVVRWMAAPMSEADVFVVPGGRHPRYLGLTGWRKNLKMQSIVVLYNNAGVDTLIHELGHVLGLEHDPDDHRSIMYPNNSRALPRIQPQDLAILRRLYGNQAG